ncbi:MAG: hypothetical protein FJX71_02200 [Alphaproteobacteria bacterium]|nr:hypothetical protein [Alphaproteobacteria bacterium]
MKTKLFFWIITALIGTGVICGASEAMDKRNITNSKSSSSYVKPKKTSEMRSIDEKKTNLPREVSVNGVKWQTDYKATEQGYTSYYPPNTGSMLKKVTNHLTVDGWSEEHQALLFHITILEKPTQEQGVAGKFLMQGEKLGHAHTISYLYKDGQDFITHKDSGDIIKLDGDIHDSATDKLARDFIKGLKNTYEFKNMNIKDVKTSIRLQNENQRYKERIGQSKSESSRSSDRGGSRSDSRYGDRRDSRKDLYDRDSKREDEKDKYRRKDSQGYRGDDRQDRKKHESTESSSGEHERDRDRKHNPERNRKENRDRQKEKLRDQRSTNDDTRSTSDHKDKDRKRDRKAGGTEKSDLEKDQKRREIKKGQSSDSSKGKREQSPTSKIETEGLIIIEPQTDQKPLLSKKQGLQHGGRPTTGGLIPYTSQPTPQNQNQGGLQQPQKILTEEEKRAARIEGWRKMKEQKAQESQTTQKSSDEKSMEFSEEKR